MPSCAGEDCTTGRVRLLFFVSLFPLIFHSTSLSPFSQRGTDDQTILSGHSPSTSCKGVWGGGNLEGVTEREMEMIDSSKKKNLPPFFHKPLKKMSCFPDEKRTARWDSRRTRLRISEICFIFLMFSLKKKSIRKHKEKRGKITMSSDKVKFSQMC